MVTIWQRGEEDQTPFSMAPRETLERINREYGRGDIIRIILGSQDAFIVKKQYGEELMQFRIFDVGGKKAVKALGREEFIVSHEEHNAFWQKFPQLEEA